MPITNIKPMKVGKYKNVATAFKKAIDYIANKEKTDGGILVNSFECDVEFAHIQFEDSKMTYHNITGRQQDKENDVIGYSLIQSFKGDEVSPEIANQIGMRLAEQMTKKQNAYIVTTHVNTDNVHNHIIWNATNLDCQHKWRNFFNSYKALQKASDILALKNRLPIIRHETGDVVTKRKNHREWQYEHGKQKPPSERTKLQMRIDEILKTNPKDYEELLRQVEESGYEIKKGKHLSFREKGKERFMRQKSLGGLYSEEEIKKDIEKNLRRAENDVEQIVRHVETNSMTVRNCYEFDLVIKARRYLKYGDDETNLFYTKNFKLQDLADTITFLNTTKMTITEIRKFAHEKNSMLENVQSEIEVTKSRLEEITNKQQHLYTISKTKEVYNSYKESGYSKIFKEQNLEKLKARDEAINFFKQYADESGRIALPKNDKLKQEYAKLNGILSKQYEELKIVRAENNEVFKIGRTIEKLIEHDEPKKEQLSLGHLKQIKENVVEKNPPKPKKKNYYER